MKITFEKKFLENDHLVIVYLNGTKNLNSQYPNDEVKSLVNNFQKVNNKKNEIIETLNFNANDSLQSITLAKIKDNKDDFKESKLEAFGGRILSYLEKKKKKKIAFLFETSGLDENSICSILNGLKLKSYRFEKYKTQKNENEKIVSIKIIDYSNIIKKTERNKLISDEKVTGVFLTRDLVSEPANVLYPSKFVEICNVLKKAGVVLEVLDEKKMKSLGMNALLGVSQGSVRPARIMIMKWNGSSDKKQRPISFIGKGVTFDTGGISIKPSGGMEDMKWDMGGAGVVAGLMYTLALRKAKTNVVGAVGLVENMPDGNAQRPGDVVKSMSGQTIEVLNTDAEGRLVLADVLWYVKEKYKPKLMVDLATLTGAIIVALGDRYAGLFSNNDKLAEQLYVSSKETEEFIWRLPLDEGFDKLLNCPIADMKNITGTRGAGSITAAQFLKRFVGDIAWAHLDIAGTTWSKSGTNYSRPGGTGFGVRLLDNFVKNNYG
jgi:leucyl aminopeptidase